LPFALVSYLLVLWLVVTIISDQDTCSENKNQVKTM